MEPPPKTQNSSADGRKRRAPNSIPEKLSNPLDVHANIEQTSNENHAFAVTPQHINNSLEI